MNNVSFSFVIPVFNVENYILQCVESIINQTYNNFEVILVDDGSTDGSGAICDEIKLRDERISVIHQQNQGLSGARNSGLAVAKNEYIIFLDSDDYWISNDALGIIAKNIKETSSDLVIWNFLKFIDGTNLEFNCSQFMQNERKIFYPQEQIIKEYVFRACAWDKAIKTELLKKNNLVFKVGDISEDVEWCANLLTLVSSFIYLNIPINAYRQRAGSITKFNPDKSLPYVFAHLDYLKKKCNTHSILGRNLCSYTAEQYANLLCIIGGSTLLDNKIKEIRDFSSILRYGRSKRCKLIRFFVNILSLKVTIKLLELLRNKKNRRY